MPPDTMRVTRPGPWGNPFIVGGYFMVGAGRGHPGMTWCQALGAEYADMRFTRIATAAQAIEFFRLYLARYPRDLSVLRGKNLACWCKLGEPCHADVLLELANQPHQQNSSEK